MPDKIATSEDLQTELRALWAMTEEPEPSRAKMAAALNDLAKRTAESKVAAGKSLAVMVGTALEDWGENVGNVILSKSQGLGGLRVMNEWRTITVAFKGARNNHQQIIFGYDLVSIEMVTVVLGEMEGHRISGLKFIVNTYDSPEEVAEKYFKALGRYIEENSL